MPGNWPDYRPTSSQPFARTLLGHIIQRCQFGIDSGQPNPDPRYLTVKSKAQECLDNHVHDNHTDFINVPVGDGVPMGGESTPGETNLSKAYAQIQACRTEVSPPTLDLDQAIIHIEHAGAGGGRRAESYPVTNAIDPPVTGLWPDVRTGLSRQPKSMTGRTLLQGIALICLGELMTPGLKASRQKNLERLLGSAMLDQLNSQHGNLRVLVKADGKGVTTKLLKKALDDVRDAYVAMADALDSPTGLTDAIVDSALDAVGHVA